MVEVDIAKFFDEVDHQLLGKAVAKHADEPWVRLYVARWLTAPLRLADGTLAARGRGTPQGSAVSPVLANLFLHYALDAWMERSFPSVPFERYVDDAVVHCVTQRQAHQVRQALADRLEQVGLRLHPGKTQIVYCPTTKRREKHPVTSFDFLGYTFRARGAPDRRGRMINLLPARDQSQCPQASGCPGAVLEAAPAHWSHSG